MKKEFLKYCPNYYHIINFNFQEDDIISMKLVSIYKSCIFQTDFNNEEELKRLINLDKVLSNYIEDYLFRSNLKREILTVRVKKDNKIIKNMVDIIIKIFSDYEEYTTRKIYISKWI